MSRLRKSKSGALVRLCVIVLYPLSSMLLRVRFRNLERVPATGSVIIAANHNSYADTIFMARLVWQAGRIPRFLIKSSLFSTPLVRTVLRSTRQIPVNRGTADAAQSLHEAKAALDRGECVIIYPEGTITSDPDWWPMRAKTGVARLALMAPDVPVLPVGQWGTQFMLDIRHRRFRPIPRKPATASVGPAVDLSAYRGAEPAADLLRRMTDEIMRAITAELADLRAASPSRPGRTTSSRPPEGPQLSSTSARTSAAQPQDSVTPAPPWP
jgi:1-acyl-sn-glycerol-3-phosphate acyltransferase